MRFRVWRSRRPTNGNNYQASITNEEQRSSRQPQCRSESSRVNTSRTLCSRCRLLDFDRRLKSNDEPYSWWYEDHDGNTGARNYVESSLASSACRIGRYRDISFDDSCAACDALKTLISSSAWGTEEELFLVSAWAIERLEQGIDIARQKRPGPGRPNWGNGESLIITYAKLLYIAKKVGSPTQLWTFPHEARDAIAIIDPAANATAFGGRKVEKDVNFKQIYGWVDSCVKNHTESCPVVHPLDLKQIRLIDVKRRQVIRYIPGAEYVCLSYVWGNVKQKSQGLGQLPASLPATIEDAMAVVRQLGKEYLWIDSLCIEQENNTHKLSQISLMGLIYSSAWVTIVALSGNSVDSGLGRISTKTHKVFQKIFHIGDTAIGTLMPTLEQQISGSLWGTRAWTLQEGQLSPRCLYFTDDEIYFECMSIQCCESVQDCVSHPHQWANRRRLITRYDSSAQHQHAPGIFRNDEAVKKYSNVHFNIYFQYINEYMSRKFTYPSDTLNAISGLLQQLQKTYPDHFGGGFFWGLPIDVLPFALMWCESSSKNENRNEMPTWSWTHCGGPLAKIITVPKDPQWGPHNRSWRFDRKYFINFRRAENDSLNNIYAADPTEDNWLNQHTWGNSDSISNSYYAIALNQVPAKGTLDYDLNRLLFVEGLVFQPKLFEFIITLEGYAESPEEEHVLKVAIGSCVCWLTCYTKEISKYVLSAYSQQTPQSLCLLILHREFHAFNWFYDFLLLDYNEAVCKRLGLMKLQFPTSERMKIFNSFRPAWASLAIA